MPPGPGGTWPRKPLAQVELEGETRAVLLDMSNLFVAHTEGISIFDVQNPENPNFRSTVTLDENAEGLGFDENNLIVCSSDAGATYLSAYDNSVYPPAFLNKVQR